ncbi:MAG: hypothetical protein JKP98_05020 [Rhodobacteraceae bacterium]|nr:hypothetical protein [Paracoccaceae bacterium]
MNKPDPIPARLAALKTTPTPDLKQQWRELFDSEPPPSTAATLRADWPTASRTGLRRAEAGDVRRLERLGEELDGGDKRSAASARS